MAEFVVPSQPPPGTEERLRTALYLANAYGSATKVVLEDSHQVAWIVPEWMYLKMVESTSKDK